MATQRRNRRIRIFETSIEKLGRILSNKWKIKVVFKQGECKTDGSTIFLPALPDNADPDLMRAMQGYLDHEAAHVVFTDFKVFGRQRKNQKLLTTLNALEDPRIEKLWCKMWGGAAINLRFSHDWSMQKIAEMQEMEDPNDGVLKQMRPWDALSPFGKIIQGAMGYIYSDFEKDHWFMKDVVEPDLADRIIKCEDILREAIVADTTELTLGHAKALLKRLQEEFDEEDAEDEDDPNGEPGEPGQPGGKRGRSQPGGNQNNSGSGDEEDEEEDDQGGSSPMDPTDEELEQDNALTNMANQLKGAANQACAAEDRYMVYTTEGDVFENIRDGDRMEYKQFMQEANRMVSTMKRKMARSMLSTNVSRWEGDKLRGKINPRAIHRVAMGTDKRVFRQRVESEAYDTVVLMMVDHSGSMSGSQLDLAAKTAIIFGEILNQLSIPFSVQGFSTGNSSAAYSRKRECSQEELNTYSRWGNLWIGNYKSFDDSWANTSHRLINMRQNCRQNTYDGETLRYGAQQLLIRPEKRKILFWLNDGEPCPNGGDDYEAHRRYAKECANEVEKLVELFAIGINTDAVKDIYSNCVAIHNLNDIPGTAFRELDSLIRGGKTYRKAG